ncbi:hypothetical protein [Halogeometricum sp. CBA1124]|uniref:hypothetical protein n=1 Tax=Halogeometricum sp. CBA1124 TaxID=2668071 RepID=UPI003743CC28
MGGCLGRSGSASTVSVLAAGSLQNALTSDFRSQTDAHVEVEAHGSARAARMVAEGQRDPDIVALVLLTIAVGTVLLIYTVGTNPWQ